MLTAKISTSVIAALSGTVGLAKSESDVSRSYTQQYANGTGAGQAQEMYAATRTAAGSSTDNLDLSGVLVDGLGATVALTGVKEIIVKNNSAANQLRIGKKISNGFAGPFDQTAGSLGVIVEPNGLLRLSNPSAAGWAVVNSTGDQLSIENLGATGTSYDIIIVGK